MKVFKGAHKPGKMVEHPKPESGKALRDGLKHLKEHHAENAKEMPARPEHRRK